MKIQQILQVMLTTIYCGRQTQGIKVNGMIIIIIMEHRVYQSI